MTELRTDLLALLARTASDFISQPASEIDANIDRTLAAIGRMFDVDRAYVFRVVDAGEGLSNTHEWCAPGISAEREHLQNLPLAAVPWWMSQLHAGHPIRLTSLDELPSEATSERDILEMQGVRSLLVLPLSWRGQLEGFAGFDHVRAYRQWGEAEVEVLRMVVSTFAQAFERRRVDERIEHMAFHDALTQLPNRALLSDRLSRALAEHARSGRLLAVVYLDLDAFKRVNDTWGHEAGDRLLVAMGARLSQSLRSVDTVARMGGDEFVLVLSGLESPLEAERLVGRLVGRIAEPIEVLPGVEVSLTASVGVRLVPPSEADADVLLRQADQAMYTAKAAGRNRACVYDVERDRVAEERRRQVGRIAQAIAEGEMRLHFQPVIDLHTEEVCFAEALVRWQPAGASLRAPDEWLPMIEHDPAIARLGDWVLEQALSQGVSWLARGLCGGLSVNIAALELRDPEFPDRLQSLFARHPRVAPARVRLEVLERAALADLSTVTRTMQTCRSIGVDFALDDFGTGYSSLSFLKRLPASTLKIDRSFVETMLEDAGDRAIVKGVIDLARAFGRVSVAEGVESEGQLEALRALGCELAQGHAIAPPMPAEAFTAWLEQRRAAAGQRRVPAPGDD